MTEEFKNGLDQGRQNQKEVGLKILFLVIVSIAAGFLGGWVALERSGTEPRGQQVARQIVSEGQLISEIARVVGESVVSVNVTSQSAVDDFFGFTRNIERSSAGTGIILNESGLIITNRHVVPRGASSLSITLSDGTELTDVQVVGRTNESDPLDVAFLKVNDKKGKTLKPAKIGDSSKVQVGDKVVAIGNALGMFQNTVTSGIISGFGRSIEAGDGTSSETLQNLFQTDAAINEGNSGGPLVNMNGEIIALNTAVAGRAENIGFAIPINDISGLIKSVQEKGQLLRPYLGVAYIALTDDVAYEFNLPVKRGAYLAPRRSGSPILDNSPAAKAGLKEKDIITKINGQAVDEKNSLVSILGRYSVGEEVTLTILRDGNEQDVRVRLEAASTE